MISKRFKESAEELKPLVSHHSEYSMDQSETPRVPTKVFNIILLASHAVGLTAIILIVVWVNKFTGGFDWNDPSKEFNYHPLFLTIGMIYLYGNSIISYRMFTSIDKPKLKLVHATLHAACLIFVAIGLYAVIDFHNRTNKPNFYSLHSWVGIFASVIYFLQWAGSLYAFLYPGIAPRYRALMLPFHIQSGLIIFGISVAACLTGLTEKIFFSVGIANYSKLPASAFYPNFIGVFIVLYSILIGYLVTESSFAYKVRSNPN